MARNGPEKGGEQVEQVDSEKQRAEAVLNAAREYPDEAVRQGQEANRKMRDSVAEVVVPEKLGAEEFQAINPEMKLMAKFRRFREYDEELKATYQALATVKDQLSGLTVKLTKGSQPTRYDAYGECLRVNIKNPENLPTALAERAFAMKLKDMFPGAEIDMKGIDISLAAELLSELQKIDPSEINGKEITFRRKRRTTVHEDSVRIGAKNPEGIGEAFETKEREGLPKEFAIALDENTNLRFRSLESYNPQTSPQKINITQGKYAGFFERSGGLNYGETDDLDLDETPEHEGIALVADYVENVYLKENPNVLQELGIEDFHRLSPQQAILLCNRIAQNRMAYIKDVNDADEISKNDAMAVHQVLIEGVDENGNAMCRNFAAVTKGLFDAMKMVQKPNPEESLLNNTYCLYANTSRGGRRGNVPAGGEAYMHAWNEVVTVTEDGFDAVIIDNTWADDKLGIDPARRGNKETKVDYTDARYLNTLASLEKAANVDRGAVLRSVRTLKESTQLPKQNEVLCRKILIELSSLPSLSDEQQSLALQTLEEYINLDGVSSSAKHLSNLHDVSAAFSILKNLPKTPKTKELTAKLEEDAQQLFDTELVKCEENFFGGYKKQTRNFNILKNIVLALGDENRFDALVTTLEENGEHRRIKSLYTDRDLPLLGVNKLNIRVETGDKYNNCIQKIQAALGSISPQQRQELQIRIVDNRESQRNEFNENEIYINVNDSASEIKKVLIS